MEYVDHATGRGYACLGDDKVAVALDDIPLGRTVSPKPQRFRLADILIEEDANLSVRERSEKVESVRMSFQYFSKGETMVKIDSLENTCDN